MLDADYHLCHDTTSNLDKLTELIQEFTSLKTISEKKDHLFRIETALDQKTSGLTKLQNALSKYPEEDKSPRLIHARSMTDYLFHTLRNCLSFLQEEKQKISQMTKGEIAPLMLNQSKFPCFQLNKFEVVEKKSVTQKIRVLFKQIKTRVEDIQS